MTFLLETALAVSQLILAFYGFWLVWRVLLPLLPGPQDAHDRIAPYTEYFIDPMVQPLAARFHVHPRVISTLLLIVLAAAQVALDRLSAAL